MTNVLKSTLPLVLSEPENPQKRNVNWLRRTLVLFGLFVAIIIIFVLINVTESTTSKTLDAFCSDLKKSDYHAAYSQFSLGYQHKVAERNAVNQWVSMGIVSCTYSSIREDGDQASATINYQDVIGIDGIDQATLVRGNDGIWKIGALVTKPQNLQA
jgi:hypothetical protein